MAEGFIDESFLVVAIIGGLVFSWFNFRPKGKAKCFAAGDSRSMREIAVESGFGSVASFNRIFRENKGCTPTQYRTVYGILPGTGPF